MINTRTIKYDGRQRNHQNGLTFYFTRQGQVLNFLIDIIGDRKRKVKVTMHADMNHGRPHVHIGDHEASFAVDSGELIVGNCDAKTRKLMKTGLFAIKRICFSYGIQSKEEKGINLLFKELVATKVLRPLVY